MNNFSEPQLYNGNRKNIIKLKQGWHLIKSQHVLCDNCISKTLFFLCCLDNVNFNLQSSPFISQKNIQYFSLITFAFSLIKNICNYIFVNFFCMYTCGPYLCLVLAEAVGQCQLPFRQNYLQLWVITSVLGTELTFSSRAASILNHRSISPDPY